MATSINNPSALNLDGSLFLYNTGPASQGGGLNKYLQSPSPYGLFSFWYWTAAMPGNGKERTVLKMNPAAGFAGGIVKYFFRKASEDASPRLYIRVESASGAFVQFRTDAVPFGDRKYHNIIVVWDVSVTPNTIPVCFLDGKPLNWEIVNRGGAATFSVKYEPNQNFYIGTDGALLGTSTQEGPFKGILSEIFFDPIKEGLGSGGLAAGTDTLVYSFYDSKKGLYTFKAGQIGNDGSTVLGRKPAIYLHGYYTSFWYNHGGDSSFRASGPVPPPNTTVSDPFWWRLYYTTKTYFQGGPTTQFEEPTATGVSGARASLFKPRAVLEANASEVKPATADSGKGLVSFWYNASENNFGGATVISTTLGLGEDDNTGYRGYSQTYGLRIDIGVGGLSLKTSNLTNRIFNLDQYLASGYTPAGGNADAYMQFDSDAGLPNDGAWHHVALAWNTNTPACVVFFDGSPLTMILRPWSTTYADFAASFPSIAYASASPDGMTWQIGGYYSSHNLGGFGREYIGHLSEVYINVGDFDFVGALTTTLVERFRHLKTGTAREIGTTASFPIPSAPRPNFYLSGGPGEFVNSFAKTNGMLGHRWGADGTDTDSTFSMRVIGGPLANPNGDPFKAQELVA